jgi:hypothetical protein
MKHPVSVLRAVDNTNKSASAAKADACVEHLKSITSEYGVLNKALMRTREQLEDLFTGCSPENDATIRQYLDSPKEVDRWLLDGWEKCGRNDRGRTVRVELSEVGRKTMTPLGIACLVRYCRGWIDEAETKVEAMRLEVERLASDPPQDSPTAPDQAPTPKQRRSPKVAAAHPRHSKPSQRQRARQRK